MSVDIKDILKGLVTETLQDLYLKEYPDQRGTKVNKNTMVTTISKTVEEAGVKTLLSYLKREELAALVTSAGITIKEGDNKNSKAVLSRHLLRAISESNIHDFLNEHADDDLLKAIASTLDVETESDKKADLVKGITDAVRTIGLEAYFGAFDVDQLNDVAEDLKLKTGQTNNKRKLVDAIINKKDVEKSPKKKKARVEASKKKKPIEKGATYEDIFQHYYVNEVRDWCKEHGLKTSGKKGALIRRILAYLDGDEETTKPKPAGKRGKKKRGRSKKEQDDKKTDDKTNDAK